MNSMEGPLTNLVILKLWSLRVCGLVHVVLEVISISIFNSLGLVQVYFLTIYNLI